MTEKYFSLLLQRQKKDGTKVNVPLHPSDLQIQLLNLDDKERSNALSIKSASENPILKKEIVKPKTKGEQNASN